MQVTDCIYFMTSIECDWRWNKIEEEKSTSEYVSRRFLFSLRFLSECFVLCGSVDRLPGNGTSAGRVGCGWRQNLPNFVSCFTIDFYKKKTAVSVYEMIIFCALLLSLCGADAWKWRNSRPFGQIEQVPISPEVNMTTVNSFQLL